MTRLNEAFNKIKVAEENNSDKGFWEGVKQTFEETKRDMADFKHQTFDVNKIETYEYADKTSDAIVVKYPINKRGWKVCVQMLPSDTDLVLQMLWTEDRHGTKNIDKVLQGLEVDPSEYLKDIKASSKLSLLPVKIEISSRGMINLVLAENEHLVYDANGNLDVSDEVLRKLIGDTNTLQDLTLEEVTALYEALSKIKKAVISPTQKQIMETLEKRIEKEKDKPTETDTPDTAIKDKDKIEKIGRAIMGKNGWNDMIKTIKKAWVGLI